MNNSDSTPPSPSSRSRRASLNIKISCLKHTGRSLKKFRDELLTITKLDEEQIVEVLRLPDGKSLVKKRIKRLTFFELCMVSRAADNLAKIYHCGGNLKLGG